MTITFRNPFTNQYGDKKTEGFKFWSLGLVYYNQSITLNLLFWGVTMIWRMQERTDRGTR